MSLRPLALGLLATAALLAPALSAAMAADLDENYGYAEAPQEVPVAQLPQTKVEFGTGWYVRGDLGATTLPDLALTQPALGDAPDVVLRHSSKLGYTADLGAGYQILPNVRADVTFDFHEPIKVATAGYGFGCPQSYKQGAQTGSTSSTTITSTNTVTSGSNLTTANGKTESNNQSTSSSSGTSSSTFDNSTTTNGVPNRSIGTTNEANNSTSSNSSSASGTTNSSNNNGNSSSNSTTTTSTTSTPTYAYNLVNGACNNQTKASISRYDVLVNAYYDIISWHGITPYVGAGLGVSFGHYSTSLSYLNGDGSSYSTSLTNPSTGVVTYYNFDQRRSGEYYNFAFALMAGIAFDVLPHTKIDIGYRYLNEGRVLGVNLYEHQARAGLRYMIDN